uniref:Cilia- and flagella-associated protein 36 n=1 Tax=Globisporangium ultimum (strain ATCC 200006 / CBS 805.95 / DAOM BR144) TaxID=431595 RepID=K3WSI3_GLOUD
MPRDERKSADSDSDDEKKYDACSRKADAKDAFNGDHDDAKRKKDGSDLVGKVIAYFFDDEAFAATFEQFAEANCLAFDIESDEMKLEYTAIYNKFLALFESKLEDYIVSQGATVKQFYDLVREAYATNRESSIVLCSEILVATADFDVFVMMMKQTKESLLLAKH